jgi:hypothetical protein
MKNIFLILFAMFSCNGKNKPVENRTKGMAQIITNAIDERPIVFFDSDSLSANAKHYLIAKFNNEFEGLKDNDITSIKPVDITTVKGWGLVNIYEIKLSDSLPEVFTKRNYLIVNVDKKQGAVFLLDTLAFIKTSIQNRDVLLGGVQKIKDKGFFKVYSFVEGNKFKEVLNTLNFCDDGVPVFNNSTECKSYKSAMLTFKNVDVNNDGLLDLNFSGEVASYCKGLESGHGRNDRPPVKIDKINFSFLLEGRNDLKYKFNDKKDSVCNLLNSN